VVLGESLGESLELAAARAAVATGPIGLLERPRRGWHGMDVASDSTGIHLVAVTSLGGVNPDGNIWTSADAGATWTNRTKAPRRLAKTGRPWRQTRPEPPRRRYLCYGCPH